MNQMFLLSTYRHAIINYFGKHKNYATRLSIHIQRAFS